MYGQRDWGMGGGVVRVEMSVWLSMYESEEKTNEKAWGPSCYNPVIQQQRCQGWTWNVVRG
jgi:hypothetical protein